jgi:hypothetical protein
MGNSFSDYYQAGLGLASSPTTGAFDALKLQDMKENMGLKGAQTQEIMQKMATEARTPDIMKGVDFSKPESLTSAANQFAQVGNLPAATQMAGLADKTGKEVVANKLKTYHDSFEALTKNGDNENLQKLVEWAKNDKDIGKTFENMPDIKITGKGKYEGDGSLDAPHLKAMADQAKDPDIKAAILAATPGEKYKWKKENGDITEFKATEKPETSAQVDQNFQALRTKELLGQPLSKEEKAQMTAYKEQKTLGPSAYGGARMEIMMQTPMPVYDAKLGVQRYATKRETDQEPMRFTTPAEGDKIKAKTAIFGEIEQSSDYLKDVAKNIKYNTGSLAKFAYVLKTNDNGGAISNFLQSKAGQTLTADELNYVNGIKNLRESAYALRQAGGSSAQSSDMLRTAIDGMVPSGKTFSKADFDSQMKLFDMQAAKLKEGVSRFGVKQEEKKTDEKISYSVSGKKYSIPKDKEKEFLKDHPDAKKVQ